MANEPDDDGIRWRDSAPSSTNNDGIRWFDAPLAQPATKPMAEPPAVVEQLATNQRPIAPAPVTAPTVATPSAVAPPARTAPLTPDEVRQKTFRQQLDDIAKKNDGQHVAPRAATPSAPSTPVAGPSDVWQGIASIPYSTAQTAARIIRSPFIPDKLSALDPVAMLVAQATGKTQPEVTRNIKEGMASAIEGAAAFLPYTKAAAERVQSIPDVSPLKDPSGWFYGNLSKMLSGSAQMQAYGKAAQSPMGAATGLLAATMDSATQFQDAAVDLGIPKDDQQLLSLSRTYGPFIGALTVLEQAFLGTAMGRQGFKKAYAQILKDPRWAKAIVAAGIPLAGVEQLGIEGLQYVALKQLREDFINRNSRWVPKIDPKTNQPEIDPKTKKPFVVRQPIGPAANLKELPPFDAWAATRRGLTQGAMGAGIGGARQKFNVEWDKAKVEYGKAQAEQVAKVKARVGALEQTSAENAKVVDALRGDQMRKVLDDADRQISSLPNKDDAGNAVSISKADRAAMLLYAVRSMTRDDPELARIFSGMDDSEIIGRVEQATKKQGGADVREMIAKEIDDRIAKASTLAGHRVAILSQAEFNAMMNGEIVPLNPSRVHASMEDANRGVAGEYGEGRGGEVLVTLPKDFIGDAIEKSQALHAITKGGENGEWVSAVPVSVSKETVGVGAEGEVGTVAPKAAGLTETQKQEAASIDAEIAAIKANVQAEREALPLQQRFDRARAALEPLNPALKMDEFWNAFGTEATPERVAKMEQMLDSLTAKQKVEKQRALQKSVDDLAAETGVEIPSVRQPDPLLRRPTEEREVALSGMLGDKPKPVVITERERAGLKESLSPTDVVGDYGPVSRNGSRIKFNKQVLAPQSGEVEVRRNGEPLPLPPRLPFTPDETRLLRNEGASEAQLLSATGAKVRGKPVEVGSVESQIAIEQLKADGVIVERADPNTGKSKFFIAPGRGLPGEANIPAEQPAKPPTPEQVEYSRRHNEMGGDGASMWQVVDGAVKLGFTRDQAKKLLSEYGSAEKVQKAIASNDVRPQETRMALESGAIHPKKFWEGWLPRNFGGELVRHFRLTDNTVFKFPRLLRMTQEARQRIEDGFTKYTEEFFGIHKDIEKIVNNPDDPEAAAFMSVVSHKDPVEDATVPVVTKGLPAKNMLGRPKTMSVTRSQLLHMKALLEGARADGREAQELRLWREQGVPIVGNNRVDDTRILAGVSEEQMADFVKKHLDTPDMVRAEKFTRKITEKYGELLRQVAHARGIPYELVEAYVRQMRLSDSSVELGGMIYDPSARLTDQAYTKHRADSAENPLIVTGYDKFFQEYVRRVSSILAAEKTLKPVVSMVDLFAKQKGVAPSIGRDTISMFNSIMKELYVPGSSDMGNADRATKAAMTYINFRIPAIFSGNIPVSITQSTAINPLNVDYSPAAVNEAYRQLMLGDLGRTPEDAQAITRILDQPEAAALWVRNETESGGKGLGQFTEDLASAHILHSSGSGGKVFLVPWVDRRTIFSTVRAALYDTKIERPDLQGVELEREVARRATETVMRQQPSQSMIHRTIAANSPNFINRMRTIFRSAPNAIRNEIMDDIDVGANSKDPRVRKYKFMRAARMIAHGVAMPNAIATLNRDILAGGLPLAIGRAVATAMGNEVPLERAEDEQKRRAARTNLASQWLGRTGGEGFNSALQWVAEPAIDIVSDALYNGKDLMKALQSLPNKVSGIDRLLTAEASRITRLSRSFSKMRSAADAYNTETDPQKAEKYKREMDRIGKNMADDITYMVNFLARAQATAMVRMVASLGGSNVVGEKISKLYEGRRLDAAFEKKVSKPFEAQDKELKQQEEVDAIRRGG